MREGRLVSAQLKMEILHTAEMPPKLFLRGNGRVHCVEVLVL